MSAVIYPLWLLSILYYLVWIGTIYLASRGFGLSATMVHLLYGILLVITSHPPQRHHLWRRGLLACFIGYTFDSSLVIFNLISFPTQSLMGEISPFWMTSLWFTFAILLNRELKWLLQRRTLAISLGLIGGPLSYLGGAQSGAMSVSHPPELAALVIGSGWGVLMGLASYFWSGEDRPRQTEVNRELK